MPKLKHTSTGVCPTWQCSSSGGLPAMIARLPGEDSSSPLCMPPSPPPDRAAPASVIPVYAITVKSE